MFGIIYKITNTINHKVYIGQTIQTLEARWYRHCSKSSNKNELNMAIKKAIFKYGKENFTIEKLESCEKTKLDEREIYWIAYYNSYKEGYNSTLGGTKGAKLQKLLQETSDIITSYLNGKSLRDLGRIYKVDHATIKLILNRNNINLRVTRTYKLSQIDRVNILNLINSGVSRTEIIKTYNISKSYLSQLINGKRRI